MGQFSWLDCVSGKQIVDDKVKDVYVLIPKEFGGGHLVEHCYDGYGNFDGCDIYDLVATWNREILSNKPNYFFPYAVKRAQWISTKYSWKSDYSEKIDIQIRNKNWYEAYSNLDLTEDEVCEQCDVDWRWIGIELACYDEDNAALPYPIKITYDANAVYEHCAPSKSDPNQGWEYDNEDEEEEDDWY